MKRGIDRFIIRRKLEVLGKGRGRIKDKYELDLRVNVFKFVCKRKFYD